MKFYKSEVQFELDQDEINVILEVMDISDEIEKGLQEHGLDHIKNSYLGDEESLDSIARTYNFLDHIVSADIAFKKEEEKPFISGADLLTILQTKEESEPRDTRGDIYENFSNEIAKMDWKDIAHKLGVSEQTLRNYRKKLDINTKN